MRARLLCSFLSLATLAACVAEPPVPGAVPTPQPTFPGEPARIVVWSAKPLPARLARGARALPGVVASSVRRSGMVSLERVIGADLVLPSKPPGSIRPASIEAVSGDLLGAFPPAAEAGEAVARGEAAVSVTTADARGLDVGDAIVLRSGRRRARLTVGALIDDTLTRAEILVPPQVARALGLRAARGYVFAVDPSTTSQATEDIRRVLGRFPARIRTVDPAEPTPGGTLLPLRDVKALFGEFWFEPRHGLGIRIDPAWVRANIARVRVPLLGRFRCHRKIVPALQGAMNELRVRGLSHLIESFEGCYSPRFQVSGNGELSRHAFGIAVDINAVTGNWYGQRPHQDARLVATMERWGFTWGGRWTIPDGMHFEYVGLTAAQ